MDVKIFSHQGELVVIFGDMYRSWVARLTGHRLGSPGQSTSDQDQPDHTRIGPAPPYSPQSKGIKPVTNTIMNKIRRTINSIRDYFA